MSKPEEFIKEFISESDYDTTVYNRKRPMLIEFYTPWCEPCKELEPVIAHLSEEFKDIAFYRYNMDKLYYRASVLGIKGIPTTVLVLPAIDISKQPSIFDQIHGYVTTNTLRPKLEALIKRWKELFI